MNKHVYMTLDEQSLHLHTVISEKFCLFEWSVAIKQQCLLILSISIEDKSLFS
jgi:hypothetical protein